MDTIEIKNTTWDLTKLFESDIDPRITQKRIVWEKSVKEFVNTWKNNTTYLQDPHILKQALEHFERLSTSFGAATDEYQGSSSDEVYYFWLKAQQDQNDPKIKARFNKVEEFSKKVENDLSFFTLNLGTIAKEKQAAFLAHRELQTYKHFLERTFQDAKHTLSIQEEKIMNLKSPSSSELWKQMTAGFLSREERTVVSEEETSVTKTFPDLVSLLQSKQKRVRDSAAAAINDILQNNVDVAEAEMNALLYDKKVNDELRGFSRPDAARHMNDDIESEVVDTLITTVTEAFSVAHELYALKAQLLGVKKLAYHERMVPYGQVDTKFTYEESVDLVARVFQKLDPEFLAIFKRFVEQGHIDVYPKKGKRDGAFCVHFLKSQPTYIMLNHTETLRDVATLAHELGHGINNELMRAQHALYFETSLATAEVASTFMEDFVFDELLNNADEEEQLSLLIQKLDNDITTIFRQIACYNFETALHKAYREAGHLAKEDIGTIFQEHMAAYMGPFVEQSEGSENWWVHWAHIRSYFYVYSYASGLLISKAMQRKVRKDPSFITNVKAFLAAGTSQSPKDLFLDMGIDITKAAFWEEGIAEVKDLLKKTTALARKLGNISG